MLEEIINFRQLSEDLATSGQPGPEHFAQIAQADYELVINLALTSSDHALPDESRAVLENGMEYVHIPVIWERPTHTNLVNFFAVMDANQGRKIYVHCALNMRVSAFMALYRVKRLGWTVETAFQLVNDIWQPYGVWESFIREALAA